MNLFSKFFSAAQFKLFLVDFFKLLKSPLAAFWRDLGFSSSAFLSSGKSLFAGVPSYNKEKNSSFDVLFRRYTFAAYYVF